MWVIVVGCPVVLLVNLLEALTADFHFNQDHGTSSSRGPDDLYLVTGANCKNRSSRLALNISLNFQMQRLIMDLLLLRGPAVAQVSGRVGSPSLRIWEGRVKRSYWASLVDFEPALGQDDSLAHGS